MRHTRCRWPAALLLCVSPAIGISLAAASRELTFERRVVAQRAIEQVYYSRQCGPFARFGVDTPKGGCKCAPFLHSRS